MIPALSTNPYGFQGAFKPKSGAVHFSASRPIPGSAQTGYFIERDVVLSAQDSFDGDVIVGPGVKVTGAIITSGNLITSAGSRIEDAETRESITLKGTARDIQSAKSLFMEPGSQARNATAGYGAEIQGKITEKLVLGSQDATRTLTLGSTGEVKDATVHGACAMVRGAIGQLTMTQPKASVLRHQSACIENPVVFTQGGVEVQTFD